MDNCEHLLDPVRDVVEFILAQCPQTHIVATSRQTLDLPEEYVFDVAPLDLASSEILFRRTAARRGRPIQEAPSTLKLVRKICVMLEGLPLAIALAASVLRTQTLKELAENLHAILAASDDQSRRHRSLRAMTEWSYRSLSAHEVQLMLSVSPLHGWWTVEYSFAACGSEGPDTEEATQECLRNLVSKSLVILEDDGIGPRYRILEPIREDALHRLASSGQEQVVRRRLREAVLDRSRQIIELFNHAGPESLRLAAREMDVISSVLRDCLRTPEGRAVGVEILVNLGALFNYMNRHREGANYQSRFLADAPRLDPVFRALALSQIVHYRAHWGESAEILDLSAAALEHAEKAGDANAMAYANCSEGMCRYYCDQFPAARDNFERSIELWKSIDLHHGVASGSIWAGKAALAMGEFEDAEAHFDRANEFLAETANDHVRATVVLNRARLDFRRGHFEQAAEAFAAAEVSFGELGDRSHQNSARIGLACSLAGLGAREGAALMLQEAEANVRDLVKDPASFYDGLGQRDFRDELLRQLGISPPEIGNQA
jgi:predicted ATPase